MIDVVYLRAATANLTMVADWYSDDPDDPMVQEILDQIPKRAANAAFQAGVDEARKYEREQIVAKLRRQANEMQRRCAEVGVASFHAPGLLNVADMIEMGAV